MVDASVAVMWLVCKQGIRMQENFLLVKTITKCTLSDVGCALVEIFLYVEYKNLDIALKSFKFLVTLETENV